VKESREKVQVEAKAKVKARGWRLRGELKMKNREWRGKKGGGWRQNFKVQNPNTENSKCQMTNN
jgi:hypothetical protein